MVESIKTLPSFQLFGLATLSKRLTLRVRTLFLIMQLRLTNADAHIHLHIILKGTGNSCGLHTDVVWNTTAEKSLMHPHNWDLTRFLSWALLIYLPREPIDRDTKSSAGDISELPACRQIVAASNAYNALQVTPIQNILHFFSCLCLMMILIR